MYINFWFALVIGMYLGDICASKVDKDWYNRPSHFWLSSLRWIAVFMVFI